MLSPRQLAHGLLARLLARVLILALVAGLLPADARASVSASTTTTDSYALPDLTPEAPASAREGLVCVVVVVADPSGLTKTAFGELLGHSGTDAQPYAFTGEPLDPNSGFQYHRARWMDARVGRFTSIDSWPGIVSDPPSLHRYTYVRNSPVNRTDPLGLYDADLGYAVEAALEGPYRDSHPGHKVVFGSEAKLGLVPGIKPDILNLTKGVYLELKPMSLRGILHGVTQLALYEYGLGQLGFRTENEWKPPRIVVALGQRVVLFNVEGLILYSDATELAKELVALTSIAAARQFLRNPRLLVSALNEFARIGRLVSVGTGARSYQLSNQIGVATLIVSLGGF